MNTIAENNGTKPVDEAVLHDLVEKNKFSQRDKGNFFTIFKSPVLRNRALIMYWNWLTASFVLYGLDLNWQTLTSSLFANFMIGSYDADEFLPAIRLEKRL